MSAIFQILEGESSRGDIRVDKDTILIGRSGSQDVALNNPSVSRRHCVIEKRRGTWSVSDESSRNGTILNGKPVIGRREMHHGDVLEAGEVVLRVGLDRPLDDDSKNKQSVSYNTLLNALCALLILIAVGGAGYFGQAVMSYRRTAEGMKNKNLPSALDWVTERRIFIPIDNKESIDDPVSVRGMEIDNARQLVYRTLDDGRLGRDWMTITNQAPRRRYRPVVNWDSNNPWSANDNPENMPRLFEGLDLDLSGGEQILLSNYFYERTFVFTRDIDDLYGFIYFEIEAWGGHGPQFGREEMPLLRWLEFPHYAPGDSMKLREITPVSHDRFEGVERATFSEHKKLSARQPWQIAFLTPSREEKMVTVLAPDAANHEVMVDGVTYAFFHDGCRYMATVRGSRNLLNRFQGGLPTLAENFLNGIEISRTRENRELPLSRVERMLDENITKLKNHVRKQTTIIDEINLGDLVSAREAILASQQWDLDPGDPKLNRVREKQRELARIYFRVRDECQKSLENSANILYQNRQDEARSVQFAFVELDRMNRFLTRSRLLDLQNNEAGYPDWMIYFGGVRQQATYSKYRPPRI